MTTNAAWIVPSSISGAVLVVSGLTYRIVRRQNRHVGWSVEPDEPHGPARRVVIRRTTGPAAHNVTANVLGSVAAGSANIERLDPGGKLTVSYYPAAEQPIMGVTVEWDGRFGRRKHWHSGL